MIKNNYLLIADSFKYALTKALPGIMGFFSVIIIVKIVGPEEYGKYSILLSFILTLSAFCVGWLNQALLRYYPGYNSTQELENHAMIALVISVIIGVSILLAISLLIRNNILSFVQIPLSIGLFVAVSLFQFLSSIYRAQLRPNTVIIITSVQSILALLIPLFFIYNFSPKVKYIILGLTIAYIIPTLGKVLSKLFVWKNFLIFTSIVNQESKALLLDLFRFGWPLSIWITINLSLSFFDRSFIKYYYSFDQTGIYASIYDLVIRFFSIILFPITIAMHPRIMKLWNNEDHKNAIYLWKYAMKMQIVAFAGIITFGVLFYENIISLLTWVFNDLDPNYFYLLPYLAVGGFIWQFALLIHKPLELLKKTHLMLIAMILSLIVNLTGNILFLPKWGLIATAYTYIVSGTVYILFSFYLAKNSFREKKLFV